ncbi:MAG: outer membrane lipoprotein chaperone LolA [Oceanococcus sp.]
MRFGLFALLSLLITPLYASSALEDLKQFYRGVDALAGDFEQRLLDEDGDTLERFAGRFWMQRPGQFLWLYDTPYEQQLGSDGDTLWYYDVDLKQINLRDAKQSLSGTPAELLGGDLQQLQAYEITELSTEDELQWLQLKPKGDDADFEDIRIGLVKGQPARIRLVDRLGQVTVMQLHDLRANPQIEPERFQLVLPDKVTVVDERAPD